MPQGWSALASETDGYQGPPYGRGDGEWRRKVWPTAGSIKGRLRRLLPAMRTFGIIFDLDARSTGRDRSRLIGIRSQAS